MLEASFEPFISCWQTLIQCALLYHQRKPSICNRNKFGSVHLPRINAFGFRLQSSCQFGACPWYSGETVSELLNIRNYRLQTETSFELLLDAGDQIPVGNRGWAFCGFVEAWALQQKLCMAQKLQTPNCPHFSPKSTGSTRSGCYFLDQSGRKSWSQLIFMEWSEWTTPEGSWNNTTGKLQRDGLGHILRERDGCGETGEDEAMTFSTDLEIK